MWIDSVSQLLTYLTLIISLIKVLEFLVPRINKIRKSLVNFLLSRDRTASGQTVKEETLKSVFHLSGYIISWVLVLLLSFLLVHSNVEKSGLRRDVSTLLRHVEDLKSEVDLLRVENSKFVDSTYNWVGR